MTPIWFLLDSDDTHDYVVFTTHSSGVKGRCLLRNPRFALCVDDETAPYACVTVSAEAIISEEPAEMLAWASELGGRHMGAERAREYGERNAVPGELLVRGRITRVIANGAIAE